MAITRQKKSDVISVLTDSFKNARISIFTDFQGTNVEKLNNLRSKIRASGGSFKVAKKTLIHRSMDEAGLSGIDPRELQGEIAVTFGMSDVALVSKAAYQEAKTVGTFKILGGFMDGTVLSVADITQLATLPSRQELLTAIVRSINAPRGGFVNVCAANIRGLVVALNAIVQKK